jgi:peptide/nickel transport system substrate-binding protein
MTEKSATTVGDFAKGRGRTRDRPNGQSLRHFAKDASMKNFSAVIVLATLVTGTALAQANAAGDDRAALMSQHRGGVIRAVANAAAGTMDPQINYTLQYWQLYQAIYDGLVAFKKAQGAEGFTVVADLAEEMPSPQDDGKTYVFKLRKGIKFSNGEAVTVKDVVASFQRIFKINGPTSGTFYNGIVGADACIKTSASCTLDGGVVGDEAANTITFHLTQADPEFLYKLAVPHASILPAATPPRDMGNDVIPGTGAYKIEKYDPNNRIHIVRNPYFKEWSVDAQPNAFADEILYKFGVPEDQAINEIQRGGDDNADWMFDPPPAGRLREISNGKYKDQLHVNSLTAVWYAPLNVNLPPFNDIRVRQALNYAVNRDELVTLFGGRNLAAPVCQILPPGFPGHVASCLYTAHPGTTWSAPDLDKAQRLIEDSKTKGEKVEVVTEESDLSKSIGSYIRDVLEQLGYNVSVHSMSSDIQFTYVQNTNNKVQISIDQWSQDYPAASDFLNVLLSCDSFHPHSDSSINISGMCDKTLDARMQGAMKLALTDPEGANAEWADIDKAYMEEAPWVPLFTPKHVDFVSKRLGNFTFSNQFYWLPALSWVQ